MHIKIEIEGAPPEVNAALADRIDDEWGRYGNNKATLELLVAAAKARANQIYADLDEGSEPHLDDLRVIAEELTVIAAYIDTLAQPAFPEFERQGRFMAIGAGIDRTERVSVDA